MAHKNTASANKTSADNSRLKVANTESYNNLMHSMDYFSLFGFLLAGLANYMMNEKHMSE